MRNVTRRTLIAGAIGALGSTTPSLAFAQSGATPEAESQTHYAITVPADELPTSQVVIGVVEVELAPGTTLTYPDGSSPESVAIDHVLEGGYSLVTDSPVLVVQEDGSETQVPPGEEITVTTGMTVVLLENEAQQQFVTGEAPTRTLTTGIFTLDQASGESEVDGEATATFIGGEGPMSLPGSDLLVSLSADQSATPIAGEPILKFPFDDSAGTSWVLTVV